MKFQIVSLALLLSFSSMAASKLGSKCGLTDSKDDEWLGVGRSINLTSAKSAFINALPTLTKQQLIIAAKEYIKGGGEEADIQNTVDAVNYLRQYSDGHSLSVSNYQVINSRVTEVLHYPGDNPNGVIFRTGTRTVVAYNGDDTILCR